ncbi:hypothetical protein O3P69_006945 [Scylla paramamosain]|uniref:G-protein coupled receptors family 1 profile domain-containing protein n=1 Tax=Scylla paramamosain TaxID=85552 RepID=A0AAW0U588_SCYPA
MSTTEATTLDSHAPDWAYLVTAIAAIIISILGFFGNLLTILALPHARRLRHSATWLVVNLAVAEGVFCVTILPISAAHLLHMLYTGQPLFDKTGCSVFVFQRYVNIQAELLSIAAIAINRCVLIAMPKSYPNVFSSRKTVGIIAGIWLVSIAIMLIPLLKVYGEFTYNDNTEECDFDDEVPQGKTPRKVFLSLGFLLPCIIIITSYSYIYYKARQSSANLLAQRRNNTTEDSRKTNSHRPKEGLRARDIRIARTIGVIFLAFLICCTPVSVAHYMEAKVSPAALMLLHPLYWAQYCINIFIYVFMNKQYRDAYVNYISQWWPDFKEMSRHRFHWREEQTSQDSRRQSRGATPNLSLRFQLNRKGSEVNSSPKVNDTRL